jgi:hypothetical protein
MPPKRLSITATDIKVAAQRVATGVTEYGKEEQLRDHAVALLKQAALAPDADQALRLVLRAGQMLERAYRYWKDRTVPVADAPKLRKKKAPLSATDLRARQDRIIAENPVVMNRKAAEAKIQQETGLSPRTQRRRLAEETGSIEDYLRRRYRGPRRRKG